MAEAAEPARPLDGVVVIDLSHIYNGPYATFLMAMAGAKVIKVEPRGGEHLRARAALGGASLPFAMLNSNKLCTTLNLKTDRGRELLVEMARRADVLVENFAPGVTDRLGIGPAALQGVNPRLIYASSSGYGRSGPYRDYPAMDITVQAMSGVMSVTGFPDDPPVKAGPAVCDFSAGVHLYGGVVTALFERERTGRGRIVEVSMQESVYASLSSNLALYHGSGGRASVRTGNRHGGVAEAPYNTYPTSDGYIAIICTTTRHFQALLKAMGREDLSADPRFADLKSRVAHVDAIDVLVENWTRSRTKAALVEALLAHRVPHAAVRDLGEVLADPHMHARGTLQEIEHPEYGPLTVFAGPIHYQDAPPPALTPSGRLGTDNFAVLHDWLGLDAAEIEALSEAEVI
jgi:CoA:oxalate CoA-transferase